MIQAPAAKELQPALFSTSDCSSVVAVVMYKRCWDELDEQRVS